MPAFHLKADFHLREQRTDRNVRSQPRAGFAGSFRCFIGPVIQILRYAASSGYLPTLPLRQSLSQSRATFSPSARSFSVKSRLRLNFDEYRKPCGRLKVAHHASGGKHFRRGAKPASRAIENRVGSRPRLLVSPLKGLALSHEPRTPGLAGGPGKPQEWGAPHEPVLLVWDDERVSIAGLAQPRGPSTRACALAQDDRPRNLFFSVP